MKSPWHTDRVGPTGHGDASARPRRQFAGGASATARLRPYLDESPSRRYRHRCKPGTIRIDRKYCGPATRTQSPPSDGSYLGEPRHRSVPLPRAPTLTRASATGASSADAAQFHRRSVVSAGAPLDEIRDQYGCGPQSHRRVLSRDSTRSSGPAQEPAARFDRRASYWYPKRDVRWSTLHRR
jgi:hypothetical protein